MIYTVTYKLSKYPFKLRKLPKESLIQNIKLYGFKTGFVCWLQTKLFGYNSLDLNDLDVFLAKNIFNLLIEYRRREFISSPLTQKETQTMINSFSDIILEATSMEKWEKRWGVKEFMDSKEFNKQWKSAYKHSEILRQKGLKLFAEKFNYLWF